MLSTHANAIRNVTPFPHDAFAVLERGTQLNTQHLARRTQRAVPAGGKFSLQPTPSARHASVVRRAQRVAEGRGVDVLERRGFKFFGTHPDLHLALQAANIRRHYYAEHDVIYVTKPGNGHIVVQGNAELLIARYQDVPFAIKAYWDTRDARKIRVYNIRRYLAIHGCLGPFREPLYRFLNPAEQHLVSTSPQDLVDAFVTIAWMEDEWME